MSKNEPKRKTIAENRRARHDFEIQERLEAGMVLTGSEVKSVRAGKASIAEAYVRFTDGEAWLVDAHITPYPQAGPFNHEPRRMRKLLLSRGEIRRWTRKVKEKGLTAFPLKLYLSGSWIKLEIGLGRGRKRHDKRQEMKAKDDKRDMERALRRG